MSIHGSRLGTPANRTSNHASSTSARWYSSPDNVMSEGGRVCAICDLVSPSDLQSMISRWTSRYSLNILSSGAFLSGSVRIRSASHQPVSEQLFEAGGHGAVARDRHQVHPVEGTGVPDVQDHGAGSLDAGHRVLRHLV